MAQFYKGLKLNIKDAMAISGFPANWQELIHQATRLVDNFRCRSQENKDIISMWKHSNTTRLGGGRPRYLDEIDWVAGSVIKLYRKSRRTMPSLKKKEKGECYNCGKKGYYARECRSTKQAGAAKPNKLREPRKKANTVEHGKES
jgi:hypothetical protein